VLKKFLSSILVITLCLILLPTSVLAEEETVESYEPMRISSGKIGYFKIMDIISVPLHHQILLKAVLFKL